MSADHSKRVTVWVQHFADRAYLMLQWYDPDTGKRKSRSAETNNPMEAEKKRADLEYELNHGLYQEPSKITWERFRELFEAEFVSARRDNTQRNYRAALDLFERLCSPRAVRLVNERTVSAFAAGMRTVEVPGRGKGMQPSSIKVTLRHLRTALRWAVEQKLLADLPAFPPVKVPKKKPQPVPAETFERILARATDEQTRTYLLCGWLAGLRLREAFALEWEPTTQAPYIDLAGNRIVLPAEIVKAVEDQWVPLDPELRQMLLALPRHGKKVFRFLNRSGRPLSAGAMSKRIRCLARAAGVRLSMKALRRGFGCRYAAKVPAQVLQRLMRHSNIAVTMDYYANVDDAAMQAVLRNSSRNNAPLGGAQGQERGEGSAVEGRDSVDAE
jgi:integrase